MKNSALTKLAILATLFTTVVVMLGAWTRLVDAGLGCPDWPGCYGFLTVPETAEEIAIAEARFPASPVEVEKGWPEMIHRYFASSLGLIIIGIVGLAYRQGRKEGFEKVPFKHSVFLLALVICQGLFGMWTVTLKLWPQVVSAHLLGGFATLSLLFLLVLRGASTEPVKLIVGQSVGRRAKNLAVLGLILVIGQIFLGAWTASNYAALACGSDFPTCQSTWWPEMDFAGGFNFMQTIGPNYLGGLFDNESRVAIQMAHRIGALLLTAYLLYMLWRLSALKGARNVRVALYAVAILLTLQVALGIINVIMLIPLHVAIAHNAVGAILLLSMVNLNYQLSRIQFLGHEPVLDDELKKPAYDVQEVNVL